MQQIEKRKVKKSDGVKIAPDSPDTENRVAADIKGATEFVKNLPQKIKSGTPDQSDIEGTSTKGLPISFNSKIIKILIGVVVAFVLLMIVGKMFQAIRNRSTGGSQESPVSQVGTPTPTDRYEISATPKLGESVYANDPVIEKTEEELDILRNEISTTSLRESLLIPPTLDFNISF